MEDKPSDEGNSLYSIPVWPNIKDQPDISCSQWATWDTNRKDIADSIVKALQTAYVTKTTFSGTISAIYNKLTTTTTKSKKK